MVHRGSGLCVIDMLVIFLSFVKRINLQTRKLKPPGYALQIGGRATESSASGKLTGPLPWDILDELSDDDDLSTTAGLPLSPFLEIPLSCGPAHHSGLTVPPCDAPVCALERALACATASAWSCIYTSLHCAMGDTRKCNVLRRQQLTSCMLPVTGTPRYSWTLSNGEPALVDNSNPARPALAGAALAEAAEQAGGRIAGWVTNMVKSGQCARLQSYMPITAPCMRERLQVIV